MEDGASGFSEAITALNDLVARLQLVAEEQDPGERIRAVADIQDEGAAPFAALLAQYLDSSRGSYAVHEVLWKSLLNYQTRLTQVLCTVAAGALTAESVARALCAVRGLIKLDLFHYKIIPAKLWRIAYALHASAEKNGFATTAVRAHGGEHTMTSVEQELLRLLMLCVSAPDMLDPEQIEVADRAVERLGGEFTLRQPGVADNPFCYEPHSKLAPRRARDDELPTQARHFGAGLGYDSLERLSRQFGSATVDEFKPFGKELSPLAQSSTVQHLLTFWHPDCPYSPPAHSAAQGTLQVVHGYDHVWQYVSENNQGTGELSLVAESAAVLQPPEVWQLRGKGGGELVVEVPQASRAWAKCGTLVGLSLQQPQRWIGLIRRMHSGPDDKLQADIAVLSDQPRAHTLREVLERNEDRGFSEAASREFGMSALNALILADGTDSAQPPNLLVTPEHWRGGRIYELRVGDVPRYLRGLKAIRRSADFVRATFEWVAAPD